MAAYSDRADKRYSYEGKPLVYDVSIESVSVELLVELDAGRYWLKRESAVRTLTNPVDFSVFNALYFSLDGIEYKRIEASEILPLSIVNLYDQLHYLDQEECTAFLKVGDKDRTGQVNTLFKTQSFDDDILKLKECKAKVDEIRKVNNAGMESLGARLKALRASISLAEENIDAEYVPLTSTKPEWDKESPEKIVMP